MIKYDEKEPKKRVSASVQDYLAEGLYQLVFSSSDTTRKIDGELVKFPYTLREGELAYWKSEHDTGENTVTKSRIQKIIVTQIGNPFSSFTIETAGATYEFMREV